MPSPVRTKTSSSDPADRRSGADRRRPVRIRSPHDETPWEAFSDFASRVYKKADQDQIFFMASAIAFNVLVAVIPLLLASLGIAGQILQRQVADPGQVLVDYLLNAIPEVSSEFRLQAQQMANNLIARTGGITILSLALFVWVSTRLIGTLRAALREVFDVGQERNIIKGKLFDIKIVVLASTLFTVNVAFTFVAGLVNNILTRAGQQFLHIRPIEFLQTFYANALAVLSGWLMFLLIYKYLPFRRIHWSTALVAATFTTVVVELLKRAFGWYVANWAEYDNIYSNVASTIILFLWIYYSAVIFILGGEVGQVYALRRIRRRQKLRLS